MRPLDIHAKYDGITRHGLDAYDERRAIYLRDRGLCMSCGKRVAFDAFQLAHRIANTKANRKRWGSRAIDHPLNRVVVCPNARCNDGQNIGGDLAACRELFSLIQNDQE